MIGKHNGNRERVRVMTEKGMSPMEIAQELGISHVTVRQHIKAIKTRSRVHNGPRNREKILAMKAQGHTQQSIATALGVSLGCVRHHLTRGA